jgi:NAD(P)-dependent dehydrogenase (short-subunit alcohol dehydrogenase family)
MTDATVANIAELTGRTVDDARAALENKQPSGRLITPDEVASAVSFCIANEALNGQAITVDGGAVQT